MLTEAKEPVSEEVSQFPAILAQGPNNHFLIVGSANKFGIRSAFSQGVQGQGVLDISAVGEDVRSATNTGVSNYVNYDGTSFCECTDLVEGI